MGILLVPVPVAKVAVSASLDSLSSQDRGFHQALLLALLRRARNAGQPSRSQRVAQEVLVGAVVVEVQVVWVLGALVFLWREGRQQTVGEVPLAWLVWGMA